MLEAPSLSWGVPHPRQYVHLGQFANAEASPIFRRTVWREHLMTRAAELIGENVWIARLRSENEGTEEPQVTLVPGADAVSCQHRIPDQIVIGIGGHGA